MTLVMRGPVGGSKQHFALTKRQGIDYRVIQGSTNEWIIIFTGTDNLNWTNYAARGQLREDFRDNAPVVLTNINVTIQVPGRGYDKQLFCRIESDDSDGITALEGRYDIEIDNGTKVTRLLVDVPWQNALQVTD